MRTAFPPGHGHVAHTLTALLAAGYQALAADEALAAEEWFRQAVQLDPLFAPAWRALAETQAGARRGICLRWAEYADACRPPRPVAQHTRLPHVPRHWPLRVGAATVGAALTLLLGGEVVYRDRMLPGVHVGSIDIGNLTRSAGQEMIRHRYAVLAQRRILLQAGDQSWTLPLSRVLQDHTPGLLEAAFSYGHESSFAGRCFTRLRALTGFEHVVNDVVVDPLAIQHVVAEFAARVGRERRDAQLLHTAGGWQIVPEQAGAQIDQRKLAAALVDHIASLEPTAAGLSVPLRVELLPVAPQQTAAQLEPAREQMIALAAQPLTVQSGERSWTLDRSMLMQMDVAAGLPTVQPSAVLVLEQIERIAGEVAIAAQPSQLLREGNRVRALVPGRTGQELDREAALQQLMQALRSGAAQVNLPLRNLPPPPGEAEQLGLIAELGRGESQFVTYSSPERDANVQAGGNEIDGVLIPPGAIFSFTQTIGDITWAEGYRWGEMIEAGTVVPSLGGGICQVSTTVFRAAFWSGLEIVERHNHTWRLPWYEVDAPPGMDATIALGGPDLKVRNNTGHYIMLKVETDLQQKRQTVIVYGTPDGRQVSMQALAGGNIGVQRHVIQSDGQVAAETYVSYYTQ
ncbi:MAG: hypothetical protein CYG59_05920 [Chloroflexi bacterium]|nr:MAG: hypothetical protein CYG59_05920 [Chloroflexota bacterium]